MQVSLVKVQNSKKTPILIKLALSLLNIHNFKSKWLIVLRQTENKSEKLLSTYLHT